MSNVFFPKKSHHGYFDKSLQRTFHDKNEKREFLKAHGLGELPPASKTHMKKVVDFTRWIEDEKRKNPNFKTKEAYPD